MKMMVKLTVLLATLLLLTGVALADNCDCYEVTYTNLDLPTTDPFTSFIRICDSGYPVGSIAGLCDDLCDPPDPLYMFFDSMREQALTSHTAGACVAYLKFHGDDRYVLTGLWVGSYRATIRGHKTDTEYCICNAPPCTGTIGDFVWNDQNRNGVQDAGEPGINGVTIQLKNSGGNIIATTTSGSPGNYQFSGLCAGNYTVEAVTPVGYSPTTPNAGGDPTKDSNGSPAPVNLPADSSINLTIDFGFLIPS